MSRSIKINRNPGGAGKISMSCPPAFLVPPRAPAQRPRVARLEPPSLLLPPSPSGGWEAELKERQKKSPGSSDDEAPAAMAYSLSDYQGFSCPAHNYGRYMPTGSDARGKPVQRPASDESKQLSSSPTVFSMLKTGSFKSQSSVPSRFSATGRFPAPNLMRGGSGGGSQGSGAPLGVLSRGSSGLGRGASMDDDLDGLSNQLQFDLNLDDDGGAPASSAGMDTSAGGGLSSLPPNLL